MVRLSLQSGSDRRVYRLLARKPIQAQVVSFVIIRCVAGLLRYPAIQLRIGLFIHGCNSSLCVSKSKLQGRSDLVVVRASLLGNFIKWEKKNKRPYSWCALLGTSECHQWTCGERWSMGNLTTPLKPTPFVHGCLPTCFTAIQIFRVCSPTCNPVTR